MPGKPQHHAHGGAHGGAPPLRERVQALLWLGANGGLALAVLTLLRAVNKSEQHVFFPFLPMLAMLWFWGLNLRYFERHHVRYEVCFAPEDQRMLLRSGQVFQLCNVLTAMVLGSAAAYLAQCRAGRPGAAAAQPPLIYAALLVLLLFPGGLLYRDTRLFFGSTLWRVFTPLRSVTWADFLLADVLTSLAKALSDTERAVCHLMTGPVMVPKDATCSDASFIIPLGLALPYVWRLVQCVRVFADTGARPQLLNALKYATAFPVIILSAVKYHVPLEDWRNYYHTLWLAAALVNSTYSYVWDVERDWEISWFSQLGRQPSFPPRPVLQRELLYRPWFYYYLLASNFALRLSWTHKLSPHLRRDKTAVVLIVVGEAFRRFQWVFVRIEVELRKIQAHRPELGVLVPPAGQPLHLHSSNGAAHGSGNGLSSAHSSDKVEMVPGKH
eukprot:scaffold3.g6633.t1